VDKINIDFFIIPVRDYKKAAESRYNHGSNNGGLIGCAKNVDEQILYFHKMMSNYIYYMTKYDIPTIFIDFNKMIIDPKYLYNKLEIIFQKYNISEERFNKVYNEVSENSRPKMKVKEDNIIDKMNNDNVFVDIIKPVTDLINYIIHFAIKPNNINSDTKLIKNIEYHYQLLKTNNMKYKLNTAS
jgi:hypothetical protein